MKVSLSNYKNVKNGTLHFYPGINLITGKNGVGKTTYLDAIDEYIKAKENGKKIPENVNILSVSNVIWDHFWYAEVDNIDKTSTVEKFVMIKNLCGGEDLTTLEAKVEKEIKRLDDKFKNSKIENQYYEAKGAYDKIGAKGEGGINLAVIEDRIADTLGEIYGIKELRERRKRYAKIHELTCIMDHKMYNNDDIEFLEKKLEYFGKYIDQEKKYQDMGGEDDGEEMENARQKYKTINESISYRTKRKDELTKKEPYVAENSVGQKNCCPKCTHVCAECPKFDTIGNKKIKTNIQTLAESNELKELCLDICKMQEDQKNLLKKYPRCTISSADIKKAQEDLIQIEFDFKNVSKANVSEKYLAKYIDLPDLNQNGKRCCSHEQCIIELKHEYQEIIWHKKKYDEAQKELEKFDKTECMDALHQPEIELSDEEENEKLMDLMKELNKLNSKKENHVLLVEYDKIKSEYFLAIKEIDQLKSYKAKLSEFGNKNFKEEIKKAEMEINRYLEAITSSGHLITIKLECRNVEFAKPSLNITFLIGKEKLTRSKLSAGEGTMVDLAFMMYFWEQHNTQLILLDEPFCHLNKPSEQFDFLLKWLKTRPHVIVVVTAHNIDIEQDDYDQYFSTWHNIGEHGSVEYEKFTNDF